MKLRKLFKNRILYAVLCVLLAAVICFFLLPRMYQQQGATMSVVKVNSTVPAGTVITQSMLTTKTVGAYGVDASVVTDPAVLVGKAYRTDLNPRDLIFQDQILTLEEYIAETDPLQLALNDNKHLVSITLSSAAASVAGIPQAGDYVDIYYSHTDSIIDEYGIKKDVVSVKYPALLQDLCIYSVQNAALKELSRVESAVDTMLGTEEAVPAVITFMVTKEQEELLIYLEYSKTDEIHMVLKGSAANQE